MLFRSGLDSYQEGSKKVQFLRRNTKARPSEMSVQDLSEPFLKPQNKKRIARGDLSLNQYLAKIREIRVRIDESLLDKLLLWLKH